MTTEAGGGERRRLGIFGGTFDPIHVGHLDAAAAARQALSLDDVLFLPSHLPPHRSADPRATMFHRFAMVALAIGDQPSSRASDIELRRTGTSYTFETLAALHADGWTPSQLFFILGTDAFAEIAQWRQFDRVVDGTNIAVVGRTGTSLESALARTPLGPRVRRLDQAREPSATTGVYLIEAATRDVSSTRIRAELTAGRSIADLVPEAVERHIIKHGLYGAVDRLHGDTQVT
jgi:nicotinate-nucleotide adenylyltransferase